MRFDGIGTFTEPRKVVFDTFNAGYIHQRTTMKLLGFVVGQIYTVDLLEVGGCSSTVYLKEFPNVGLNTVFFRDHVEEAVTEGERLKEEGIAAAVAHKKPVFEVAKQLAINIAQQRPSRRVTADDVQMALIYHGYDPADLGNSAGAIFRNKNWSFTGEWVKSSRISNHARQNRVWQLV